MYHPTRGRTLQKIKNGSATEPVLLTINGDSALQDELSGPKDGINGVFLHTYGG
jgi:hypothetical protein